MKSARTVLLLALGHAASGCFLLPEPISTHGVTVKGTVKDALYKTPIAFADVCLIEPAGDCTRSNEIGEFYILNVERQSKILLRFLKNGYYPNVAQYSVGNDTEFLNYFLASDEISDLGASLAGVNRDDSKGIIIFAARTGKGPQATNVEDVGMTLTPASGDGPFYAVANGFDHNRTTTTAVGGGSYFNVEPGDYVLTYSHPDRTCRPYYGWPGPDESSLLVRVVGGFSTYTNQVCD